MAHTNHTTTNQIRQPAAMMVRNMETSCASVLWAKARMRRNVCEGRCGGMFLTARRCAELGSRDTWEC
jgi:hypothetical protein